MQVGQAGGRSIGIVVRPMPLPALRPRVRRQATSPPATARQRQLEAMARETREQRAPRPPAPPQPVADAHVSPSTSMIGLGGPHARHEQHGRSVDLAPAVADLIAGERRPAGLIERDGRGLTEARWWWRRSIEMFVFRSSVSRSSVGHGVALHARPRAGCCWSGRAPLVIWMARGGKDGLKLVKVPRSGRPSALGDPQRRRRGGYNVSPTSIGRRRRRPTLYISRATVA
jgi:hypothetical protein